MPKPGTLREVSARAGVAQSTASRVLRGLETKVAVSPQTRTRILDAARELGYRPNPLARGLRGAGAGLLGVILRDAADPLFAAALEVIATECRRVGWHVILGHAHGSSQEALDLVEIMETRYCEALVIAGDLPDDTDLWRQLEAAARVPSVGIFQGQRQLSIPTINVDNRRGTRLAMRHLHDLGHRRIALIGHTFGRGQAERAQTYDRFMAEHGLRPPRGYRQLVPNSLDGGLAAATALLALEERPTAIFAATDRLAIAAMSALYGAGLRIPRDLSIVGFDDIPAAAIASPPLTTVHQPLREIVRLAIEDLAGRARGGGAEPPPPRHLEPALAVRASTGPLPGSGAMA
jgi:DNA-binding LacI/PurR family transcriptional regulator